MQEAVLMNMTYNRYLDRHLGHERLLLTCVICGERIRPVCNLYTCGSLKCSLKYKHYRKRQNKLEKYIKTDKLRTGGRRNERR